MGQGLRRGLGACALACMLAIGLNAPALADTPPGLGPWHFESHAVGIFTRSQGLASDTSAPGITIYSWQLGLEWAGPNGQAFRRLLGTPLQLFFGGYFHIGDIDAYDGRVYIPYENGAKGTEKAYGVIDTASGRILGWSVHQLDPGETFHNSWVAVSSDGQWLASGEWEDMNTILVFAVADIGKPSIDVAFRLHLDTTLNFVQGCDFDGPVRLVCQDDTEDRRLLQIDIDHPLDGTDVDAHPTPLGSTPVDVAVPLLASVCKTPTEGEGVDVSGTTLRFMTVDPCLLWSHEYRYSRT